MTLKEDRQNRRPLTLWRYPRGIDQQGFVQQDFVDALPERMGR